MSDSSELKRLQTELRCYCEEGQSLESRLRSVKGQQASVSQKIRELTTTRPTPVVSEHAMLRFLERVRGVSVTLLIVIRYWRHWRSKWRRYIACQECTYWFTSENSYDPDYPDDAAHMDHEIQSQMACPECGCCVKAIKVMRCQGGKWIDRNQETRKLSTRQIGR